MLGILDPGLEVVPKLFNSEQIIDRLAGYVNS